MDLGNCLSQISTLHWNSIILWLPWHFPISPQWKFFQAEQYKASIYNQGKNVLGKCLHKDKTLCSTCQTFFSGKNCYQFTPRKLYPKIQVMIEHSSLFLKQSRDRKIYPSYSHALPWTLTLNLLSVHTFSKSVSIWTLVLWQLLEARHQRAHPGLLTGVLNLGEGRGRVGLYFPCHTSTISTLYSFVLLLSQNLFSEYNALSLCALHI